MACDWPSAKPFSELLVRWSGFSSTKLSTVVAALLLMLAECVNAMGVGGLRGSRQPPERHVVVTGDSQLLQIETLCNLPPRLAALQW